MKPALTSRRKNKSRTFTSASTPACWHWPCELQTGEISPDTRLLCPEIAGLNARVCFPDESVIVADVRSVSPHDIVLKVDDLSRISVRGQIVEVTLCEDDRMVLDSQKAVLHWTGVVSRRGIVALFTVNNTGDVLQPWINDDARGDIRFPVQLNAVVETADGRDVAGRIVDYSLSGCRFLCDEPLALDCEYRTSIEMPQSSVEVALRPRWVGRTDSVYQMGCTFRSEEGVLLACRHYQNSQDAPRPFSRNWKV